MRKYFPYLQWITLFLLAIGAATVFASTTDGTIDVTLKYAWGENIGWINFGAATGTNAVHITSSGLTGYAWSTNYGWIKLNASSSGVLNDGSGNLSGYAWGEQLGWINFSGVIINSSGVFTGMANGSVSGRINFDCANCKVSTDYRPNAIVQPPPPSPNPAPVAGGGAGGNTTEYTSPSPPATPPSTASPVAASTLLASLASMAQTLEEMLRLLLPQSPPPLAAPSQAIVVPQIAPLAMKGLWNLLPQDAISAFVLAPLPRELSLLTEKLPRFQKILRDVGVSHGSDLPKLRGVGLSLPHIGEAGLPPPRLPSPGLKTGEAGLPLPQLSSPGFESKGLASPEVVAGNLPIVPGIPVAALSPRLKERIPTEIVFARSPDEKIDLDIKLNLLPDGTIENRVQTVVGSVVHLVVKPEGKVNSVTGYLALKNRNKNSEVGVNNRGLNLMASLASVFFQGPVLSEAVSLEKAQIEEKLALLQFEYTDPDHDGIYTADVTMPRVDGEYEIITLVNYKDPEKGTKAIRLTTVVDPEGYVYEAEGDKEVRIPHANVSLRWLNPEINGYILWPARQYGEENPQTTDVRGTYAYLVPPGTYYITVEAPGYLSYTGEPFDVAAGNEVHSKIELHPSAFWKQWDWKTIAIVVVALLLVVNFWWDRRRGLKAVDTRNS